MTLDSVEKYDEYALVDPDYSDRDSSKLIEISSIDSNNELLFINWLNQNGKSPVDYVVEKVNQHQVIVFGENHGKRNYLVFLKNIIPDLYKAGVRVIALEYCTKEDNELLQNLVCSDKYDEKLAMDIARHQPLLVWGMYDYWAVLKSVWQLNVSLKHNQEKMKLIGLDSKWDGASLLLLSGTDNGKSGPAIEKLRIFRLINYFATFYYRDELMAKEIDDNIISKGKKGVVWVGINHSHINYKPTFTVNGRMAYLLNKKYGDKIFQIVLHNIDYSTMIGNVVEKSINKSNFNQVGFDFYKSTFSVLRDSSCEDFKNRKQICMMDLTKGYLYLVQSDSLQICDFMEDFISPEMFIKNKPYYEMWAGKSLKNNIEANDFFINNKGKY